MKNHPPSFELAVILLNLPDVLRTEHPVINISSAYAFGVADRLWSKSEAIHVMVRANMQRAEARGKGSKAHLQLSAIRAARQGVSLDDWLALEADMEDMNRDESREETARWFEALQRECVEGLS
jgi:hypothetical protein